MNIEIIGWIISAVSLTGVVLNIKKKRVCFILWTFTNAFWCGYDIYKEAYPQAVLFFVYFLLAIWGIIEWRKNK